MPLSLPIDPVLPGLLDALRARPNAVLVAPPGSGKTTRVPPALHTLGAGRVLVLQPRRVAARLAAARIAEELGVPLGGLVGYRTRFERRVGPETRIELMTEGLLLRQIQADPFLDGVACVVLDELHERSLDLDLALGLLREIQRDVRDDLHLIAMSATLDPGPVHAFLGGDALCTSLSAEGRAFPVSTRWLPRPSQRRIEEQAASAVRSALAETRQGHVLVFLPSVSSIERTAQALAEGELPSVDVLPLHGGLRAAEQDAALAPSGRRKVVLSTNLAETSVTLDGVRVVIDTGMAVVPRFDAGSGVTVLERQRVARDSADQRRGRAGRTGPGICLRLWTEDEDRLLAASSVPEVRRADLCSAALQLRAWGVDPATFAWLEAPPPGALERADALLRALGAVDESGITPLGASLASLPTHPRLGRVLVAARALAVLDDTATAAALLDGRDVVTRGWRGGPDEDDLSARLRVVAQGGGRGVRRGALMEVRAVRDQLLRAARRVERREEPRSEAPALVAALLAGYPDRVARRRGNGERYLLASGLGARLSSDSAARGAEFVLALGLEGSGEPTIRLALVLDPAWLASAEQEELVFDPQREAVVSRRVRRFGALLLEEHPSRAPADPLRQAQLLEDAARDRADALLTLDADALSMLGRVATLRALGIGDLPDLSDLSALLPTLCAGRRSFAELRKASVAQAVRDTLSWQQRQLLDAEAPERVPLPTGTPTRIQYARDGSPPVLAARIQQLFGMMETPRIANGRLPLLVHLLAPSGRPAQVTQDLASFWSSTWSEVRKDLRGRYPKHHWPEDPSDAEPTDRAKRRSR